MIWVGMEIIDTSALGHALKEFGYKSCKEIVDHNIVSLS